MWGASTFRSMAESFPAASLEQAARTYGCAAVQQEAWYITKLLLLFLELEMLKSEEVCSELWVWSPDIQLPY